MAYSLVMTACASREDAKIIIDEILQKRLAACVQLQEVESFYPWKGKIENSKEILLLIKTKSALYKELEQAISAKHKYEIPEIIHTPIAGGLGAYLNWIDEVTKA
ncbi:MAG: divalent-cation tolerance protein CutA [Christensenellales bacterium]|jgi:periplasmic divalent cation tolerance protein